MLSKRTFLVSWMFLIAAVLSGTILASNVYAQSIEEAKAKVEEMKDDPARHYNLGVAYYKEGQYNEAINAFQEAVKLDAEYKEAYYNMGLAQYSLAKNSAAIKSLKEAVKLDGQYADAHAALGNAYRKRGQHSAAARAYNAALKIKPGNAGWYYNLGIVYQTDNNLEKAVEAYRLYMKNESRKSSKRYKQIEELVKNIEEHYLN